MPIIATAFLVALLITLGAVRVSKRSAHRLLDHDLSGPQKFHGVPVPRIGGVGIFAGVCAALALIWTGGWSRDLLLPTFVLCAVPAFASGLTEDLTKTQSPRRRLFFTSVSAALGVWLLDAAITHTTIPGLDRIVAFPLGAALVTIFVVAGVSNALNIIDGFNGLASMCAVLILISIGYVAFQVDDRALVLLAAAGAAAVLGFFVWNFPLGLIFLGDGGAYFLGFYVAELAILLIHRNPSVSPMFPLLICIYPVFETVFSMYRRKVLQGKPAGMPDGIHLHSLIYRRLIRWAVDGESTKRARTLRNSMTSPYLWMLCMASVLPAMLFWDHTPLLLLFILLFGLSYSALYWRIVRFQAPRWLKSRH